MHLYQVTDILKSHAFNSHYLSLSMSFHSPGVSSNFIHFLSFILCLRLSSPCLLATNSSVHRQAYPIFDVVALEVLSDV